MSIFGLPPALWELIGRHVCTSNDSGFLDRGRLACAARGFKEALLSKTVLEPLLSSLTEMAWHDACVDACSPWSTWSHRQGSDVKHCRAGTNFLLADKFTLAAPQDPPEEAGQKMLRAVAAGTGAMQGKRFAVRVHVGLFEDPQRCCDELWRSESSFLLCL
jgi:hypothetical protein